MHTRTQTVVAAVVAAASARAVMDGVSGRRQGHLRNLAGCRLPGLAARGKSPAAFDWRNAGFHHGLPGGSS